MNIVSKIAVLLLALSILAIPAMAAEEEHIVFVKTDSQDDTITYVSAISVTGHEGLPEHAEIRPFFRDQDPECIEAFTVESVSGATLINGPVLSACPLTESVEAVSIYEFAAIP